MPYRPLRAIQDGLLLDLPEGLLWADRARSAAALSRFLRNSLAPWSSPICWWWHYLVPGESFCDPSRAFGQAVGGTRQTICWKCTFPRKTPYPHPEVSQILLFCIYPFCHVLIYKYDKFKKKIGARAMKNEPKWWVSFFPDTLYIEMTRLCWSTWYRGISLGLFKKDFLNICKSVIRKVVVFTIGDNEPKSNCRNQRIFFTQKVVSVIGARFLKAIKRQIHMLKKTHWNSTDLNACHL